MFCARTTSSNLATRQSQLLELLDHGRCCGTDRRLKLAGGAYCLWNRVAAQGRIAGPRKVVRLLREQIDRVTAVQPRLLLDRHHDGAADARAAPWRQRHDRAQQRIRPMHFQPGKTSRNVVVGIEAPEQRTGLFHILTRKPRPSERGFETVALKGCERHCPKTRKGAHILSLRSTYTSDQV